MKLLLTPNTNDPEMIELLQQHANGSRTLWGVVHVDCFVDVAAEGRLRAGLPCHAELSVMSDDTEANEDG